MAIEKFDDIAKAWAEALEKDDMVLGQNYGAKFADVLFTAVSTCLGNAKSKDHPVAFVIDEINGNFVMGAVVEYHEGKSAKDPGNWSYIWTFNAEDIPDNAKIYKLTDPEIRPFFTSYSVKRFRYSANDEYFVTCYLLMAKMISKWLSDNVSESDINGVELEGVFQARVAVEDGAVAKSIEPAGEIKVLIKDDASIEK